MFHGYWIFNMAFLFYIEISVERLYLQPFSFFLRSVRDTEMEVHMEHSDNQYKKIAMRVSTVTVIINALLSAAKLVAGIIGRSAAMVSDAVHSASDVFSTFIVMIGVKLSGKDADKQHPFGHERIECVAAILLSAALFVIGAAIGYEGITSIISGGYKEKAVPGVVALIAAIVSIVVKEWMFWYTIAASKKIGSPALRADAWHHRSDALSSIGSLIGIGAARLGFPIFDPIASVVICLFILKVAVDIFRDAADRMVDKAADAETETKLREAVLSTDGVLGIDRLMTRLFGSRLYVEVEITADGELLLNQSHEIAERVHNNIEAEFPAIKHCMVHVNPVCKKQDIHES